MIFVEKPTILLCFLLIPHLKLQFYKGFVCMGRIKKLNYLGGKDNGIYKHFLVWIDTWRYIRLWPRRIGIRVNPFVVWSNVFISDSQIKLLIPRLLDWASFWSYLLQRWSSACLRIDYLDLFQSGSHSSNPICTCCIALSSGTAVPSISPAKRLKFWILCCF